MLDDHPGEEENRVEHLKGKVLCREAVVGRNCRFLQGPGTDPAEVQKLRDGLAADKPVTVRLLNYKHDGTPFWNHLHVSPVRDARGKVCLFSHLAEKARPIWMLVNVSCPSRG